MKIRELISLAFESIKQNRSRTIITCCIIGFGIMSLVGILTSIDGLKSYISKDFSSMGANTFKIRNRALAIQMGRKHSAPKVYKAISYQEAQEFKKLFKDQYPTNIQTIGTGTGLLKYRDKKTNPNVMIMGVDENYSEVDGYQILKGRNFSFNEMLNGSHVCILGYDAALKLFGTDLDGIGKNIIQEGRRYRVIGIYESKGTSMLTTDNFSVIPINNCRQYFTNQSTSYIIGVKAEGSAQMSHAIEAATGAMRIVRKLRAKEENNFDIMKSDSISELMNENMSYATIGGFVIGLITLFGAAVGLMNIMLVSVTERTREIGTLKAIGAKNTDILTQFLIEAIVICQLGGLMGILLGIIIGNIVSLVIGGAFIIPWTWMILGVIFCLIVGLASGIYPAVKASKQDPIEALRFE